MVDFKIWKIRIRNLEIFTFISLSIIYTLAILTKTNETIFNWIANLSSTWENLSSNSSNPLWIAFLISFGGNSSVLIVVPYALVIYDLSIKNPNLWIWITIVSGIGAAIGEIVSYYAGRLIGSSNSIKNSEIGEKFHRMKVQFEKNPKMVPLTVFLFALTPLPDDVILVPMGMMKYNYLKTIIPCIIGKTILCGIICWLGSMIGNYSGFLNDLIGYYPWLGFLRLVIPSEDVNPAGDLVYFSFIFIYAIVRVNFESFMKKRNKKRREFQHFLIEGKNFTILEIIEYFQVANKDKFLIFMTEFAAKHQNISIRGDIISLNAILDNKKAHRQSLEFIDYFFTTDTGEFKKKESISESISDDDNDNEIEK